MGLDMYAYSVARMCRDLLPDRRQVEAGAFYIVNMKKTRSLRSLLALIRATVIKGLK